MWNTVLNHGFGYSKAGGNLASNTYLVCKIDSMPKPIIKGNYKGIHAEKILIDNLKEMPLLENSVTVYINNSPCADCAQILKTYLEQNEGIHLTLYVTHLYKIRRMSCKLRAGAKENEGHMNYITENEHEANYKGLRDLMNLEDNRCKIEAFTEDVWRELGEVMGFTEYFQQKKYGDKMANHDRSRKKED